MERFDDLKTIKSLLLLGAGAFLLALGTSVTATYAWFELTNAQKVSEIGMSVAEGPKLEIGLKQNLSDTIDYYESIGDKELSEHYPSYAPGMELSPVSGMNLNSWYNEETDLAAAFPVLYSLSSGIPTPIKASQGYLSFETYFRCEESGYLFLDKEGTFLSPNVETNRETEAYYGLEEGSLDAVTKCIRVSFLGNQGYRILDLYKDGETELAGRLDLNGDGYFDSLDGQEIVYGSYSGDPIYGEESDNVIDNGDSQPNSSANIAPFLKDESKENGFTPEIEHSQTIDSLSLDYNEPNFDPATQFPLAYLTADEPARLVISLYIEGWDKDASEEVVDGAFNLDLSFVCLNTMRK